MTTFPKLLLVGLARISWSWLATYLGRDRCFLAKVLESFCDAFLVAEFTGQDILRLLHGHIAPFLSARRYTSCAVVGTLPLGFDLLQHFSYC